MTGPAAALFDFDGTLVDREPLIEAAVLAACRAAGVEPADGAVVIGRAWQDVHRDLGVESELGWSVDELVDRARAHASLLIEAGHAPPVIDGGAELIERLAGSGMPVAIVSGSTRAELHEGIELLGVGRHVSLVLGAEDYRAGKPDPEPYLLAAERLAVAPRRCVVFEDSTVGIDAGLAAGMAVIAVTQANRPVGVPGHQVHERAHRIVPTLSAVDDAMLVDLIGRVPS